MRPFYKPMNVAFIISSVLMTTSAFAQNNLASDRDNVVSLAATASRNVANDEMYATLYVTEQNNSASELASSLAKQMNRALVHAKRYTDITASTGQQHTYPRYSKDNRIIGWEGRASINLKSKNFEQTSKLVAKLQKTMKLENINFKISDQKKEAIETELMQEASRKLQARANALLPIWNASNYTLVHVSLNTNSQYHSPVIGYASRNMAMESSAMPRQKFEGGDSKITVTANGSIQFR